MYIHTLQPTLQTTETGRERERAREREGKGGQRERERQRQSKQASEREREGERERKTETEREKGTDKALLPDSRQPSFPIQENATRLMQQQVQYCQTNRVKKVYSL